MRKLLRSKYPTICGGTFSNFAPKAEQVKVLEMDEGLVEAYVKEWVRLYTEGKLVKKAAVAPPEGTFVDEGGSAPVEVEVEPSLTGTPDERVLAVLPAIRMLIGGSEAAEHIESLVDFRKQHEAGVERRAKAVKANTPAYGLELHDGKPVTVELCGAQLPVICAESDEMFQYVPHRDLEYDFTAWTSRSTFGELDMEFDAADFLKALVEGDRIMLVGPPGTGKTSVVRQAAAIMKWPVMRFQGHRDISIQDFVGAYEAKEGNTVWVDGPATLAMRKGCIFINDEGDHMPAECASTTHAMTERNNPTLTLTAKGGELVRAHQNYRFVMTANTGGHGDETGTYPNAQVQNAALLSRFDKVFLVGWMPQSKERELLMNIGVAEQQAELIVDLATKTRKAHSEAITGTPIMYPITLRETMAWARETVRCGKLINGLVLCVLNKLPSSEVKAVAAMADLIIGDKGGA